MTKHSTRRRRLQHSGSRFPEISVRVSYDPHRIQGSPSKPRRGLLPAALGDKSFECQGQGAERIIARGGEWELCDTLTFIFNSARRPRLNELPEDASNVSS